MNNTIEKAKKILEQICRRFECHDKDIMQGVKGERLHALDVLDWIEKLNPSASTALKLAALFHDIDRVVTPKVGGGFKGDRSSRAYLEHKKLHAKRSVKFIVPILKKNNIKSDIIKRINFLITNHDDTGDKVEKLNDQDLNYLVTADSFAFFTSIAPKLFKAEGRGRIKDKIRFMVSKLPDSARIFLWEYQLENNIFNSFKNEIIKEFYIKNNPREKEYNFCPTCSNQLKRKLVDRQRLLFCPKCNFVFWNNPKPVVSVILKKQGKILLIKRAKTPLKNFWCLPGGYVNYSEKPESALIREVKEETNLDIKVDKLVGVYQIDNDPRGINLDIIYFGSIIGGESRLNKESSEVRYFSMDTLPKLIAYKHREAIQDWRRTINRGNL
ncbi:MAG: DUF4202 family protein [Patescibacteria group bacterium]